MTCLWRVTLLQHGEVSLTRWLTYVLRRCFPMIASLALLLLIIVAFELLLVGLAAMLHALFNSDR